MTPRTIRLWGPVLIIAVLSVIIALIAEVLVRHTETTSDRIGRAVETGDLDDAEDLLWQLLKSRPGDLQLWIRFIGIHSKLLEGGEPSSIPDTAIRQRLALIPKGPAATVAGYWYEYETTQAKPDASIVALADAPQPARYANYVLARIALDDDEHEWATAARRFEREGLAFPKEGDRYLRQAILVWVSHEAWNEIDKRMRDPRYRNLQDASLRLEVAIHQRDWPGILLWLWPAGYIHVGVWPLLLALISGGLWLVITTRLGRIADRIEGRALLYTAAFVLGIFSVYPTLLLSIVEESFFKFKIVEQPLPDAIYFVAGVGLREELSKLLLFLPLLPILLKRGSRIEAMTCGALVGLGFAAEENIGYFQHFAASAAISRFLTANFLHMSLTALLALSVFDAARGRSTARDRFNVIFPLVICIHGAYDFFLSDPEFSRFSLVSMFLLIFAARQFLRQLLIASSRMEEEGVLRLFVASLAMITGASYIYATTLVGPLMAIRLIALGGIGVAFVLYMFVRELT
jgi:RsiW-degrading membrane proteinase PrsW (M82 family)